MKKMTSIVLVSLVIIILLGMTLVHSTTTAAKKPTRLVIWHQEGTPRRVEAFQKLIDAFNKANPEFIVSQESQSWADVYQKLFGAIQAGSPPDMVLSLPDITIATHAIGALQPVDDIVESIDKKYRYVPSQLIPYYYEGHYWAVPMWGMTHLLYYNESKLKEAGFPDGPKTWNDLLVAGEKLTDPAKKQYAIGLGAQRGMYTDQVFYDFMVTNRADLFDENGEVIFDSKETIEALEFYKKLWQYCPADSLTWTGGEGQLAFISGTTAMYIVFPDLARYMDAEAKGGGPYKACLIPIPEGGRHSSITYSNGAMVLAKDKEKREGIKKFLEYMMEPENNGAWLAGMDPGVYLPITEAAINSKSFNENEAVQYYKDIIDLQFEATKDAQLFGFVHSPPAKAIGEVSGVNLLSQVLVKVLLDEMTPSEAAAWGANRMREIAADQ